MTRSQKSLIDQFFEFEKRIHDLFGYQEDWVKIPLADERHNYWMLVQDEDGGGDCVYYHEPLTPQPIRDGAIYAGPIYTQRFLKRWVYRTKQHTLVSFDKRMREFDGTVYSLPLSGPQILPEPIWRVEDISIVSVNTQTDGNRFLMVFDNTKEVKQGTELYEQCAAAWRGWQKECKRRYEEVEARMKFAAERGLLPPELAQQYIKPTPAEQIGQ